MLALHRSRCLLRSPLHCPRSSQVRTLRTLPRPIPPYIKRWDPTLYNPARESRVSTESSDPPTTPANDSALVLDKESYDATPSTAPDERHHAEKKQRALKMMKHLFSLAASPEVDYGSIRLHLWQAYKKLKSLDLKLLYQLSNRDWHRLWTKQSLKCPWRNPHRTLHLEELYRDMQFAKTPGTIAQRAEYLDCLFTNGKKEEALKEWEADDSSCDLHEHHNKRQHLNVGAKLHATAGHADLARTIMSRLYHLYPDHDSSVMMTVFRAHTSSTNEEHHDAAKDIYIGFKKRRASLMTFGDYDACLVGFLEARHLRHARQVFLDMVKDGYLASRGSAVCVEEVLQRLHMLYRLGTDISTMTSIALDAITVLPPAYHGHLFGDWMKFTVVQQAPEAASQILDMMFQRGYTPETFHFNMLLKALVRTKDDSNVLKAENIAWRMIDKARETHKSNDQPLSISERISQRLQKPTLQDLNSVRSVPVANVTTFALMMQHHAKKLQWEHVDYLSRQLKEISLTPNATIMNVLMDNKCRQGAYADAWTIYKRLTSPPRNSSNEGVFPDGASFRCLWKNLRLAYGDYATREDPNLPSPRELLREMTEWWGLCRSRHDADRFRLGLAAPDHGAITALMMHCFSYTQDLAGSLAALHVLRQKFDIFPTEKALDILQSQMAWIDMARDSQSLRSQHFHSRSNARNKERIDHVYQILRQRRLERMNLKDGDHENFTVEEIGDMGLNLLSEFVRVVLKRTYPPELVEDMMETACRSVGAPGMKTGDMDAFEVA